MKLTFTFNPIEDSQETFDAAMKLLKWEQAKGRECDMYLATFTGKRVLLVDTYTDVTEVEGGILIATPQTWYNKHMLDELGLRLDGIE